MPAKKPALYKADTAIAQAFAPMAARIEEELFTRFRNAFERYQEFMAAYYAQTPEGEEMRAMYKKGGFTRFYQIVNHKGLTLGERYSTSPKDNGYYPDAKDRTIFNAEWARKEAAQQAADIFNGFIAKFTAKVTDLEGATVTWLSGAGDCHITGNANGHRVHIDQQTIWKSSVHGNVFCQFPARIYVDGKFTPAAKYAAAIA